MKIAIIGSRGFPSTYGGYETLVRVLARDWASKGHDVTVYCRTKDEGRKSWMTEDVRCIATPGWDSQRLSTLSFGLTAIANAAFRNYDAALVLNIANGFFLPMRRVSHTATVLNTDGIEWERGKWGPVARFVFRFGARLSSEYADVLVADSVAIADIWAARFNRDSTYIPYGGDATKTAGSLRVQALGLTPGSYALAVARLIPENNIDLLLDAAELCSRKWPCVVVGSATTKSKIEARLRRMEQAGQVRWLGHVSDQNLLEELWSNAGVYVHGHSVGGTNPALVQAMGFGAPTIALDTPFNREVVRAPEQMFGHDARALCELITRVLDDPDIRAGFTGRSRRIVALDFRWEDISERYLEALRLARARRFGQ